MAFGAGVAVGGKFIGGGLTVWVAFRLFVWLCEFVARRWDAHVARVTEREALAGESIAARLKHLELEVDRWREATMMLLNRLAEVLPGDPALVEAARIMRESAPSLNELAERLRAMPGGRQGGG